MYLGINGHFEHCVRMAFENGWAISIANSPYRPNSVRIVILPAYMLSAEYAHCSPEEFEKKASAEWEKAKARGDTYDYAKGNDDGLAAIIEAVRKRKPYAEDIAADMLARVLKKE